MYLVIINFEEDINRSFLELRLDLKSLELELELKYLELELKVIASSRTGIENKGTGIELKTKMELPPTLFMNGWMAVQHCNLVGWGLEYSEIITE